MTMTVQGRRGERGSAVVEFVVLVPVLLALIALAIAFGSVRLSYGAVEAAARDAARQASLARSPAHARAVAISSVTATLTQEGLTCHNVNVTVEVGGFHRPLGQPAQVSARVQCTVSPAVLSIIVLPGSITLDARFDSPLDPYRSRALGLVTRIPEVPALDRGGR
ncbi:pilus assembly protein TadE [Spongiactinospora rosea]|uniref:Pilus assembly protein TadE n=1 Tax=Spongiactinospora rosea TaxID=2248750 RepID=A0A366LTF8_9ACTN|nr:TadE/TadG family type IV pilus assembly protein [Spongiactinospora rosea]RBQ17235.1 pilus assembly protein TadE [Spongiactinospora rosea]